MTALLRKGNAWNWTQECEQALKTLKNALVNAPILTCPNFNLQFIIQCDASSYGLGAVLLQRKPAGTENVICYISRSLTRSERNYCTTEREALAVVFAIEKLRPYVEGFHFTVVTDHHSLVWLHNLPQPTERLARWMMKLQQYDYDIVHRKGKEMIVPDLLSRSVPQVDELRIAETTAPVPQDAWHQRMMTRVTAQPLRFPKWRIQDNKLYKYVTCTYPGLREAGDYWKLVIPKTKRSSLLQEFHAGTISCHAGIYKTYERLKESFYWPRMKADVVRFLRKCTTCQETKPEQKATPGQMGRHAEATRPWQVVSIDLVGPLPKSTQARSLLHTLRPGHLQ